MKLQIKNSSIVSDKDTLNNVENPTHGDTYFVTSEGVVYSYYNTQKNAQEKECKSRWKAHQGVWVRDKDAIIYEKVSVISAENTEVTQYYPNVSLDIKEEIKRVYNQYALDGKDYDAEIRADFVYLYKTGVLTAIEVFAIEEKLKETRTQVGNGDWMTATNTIESVTVGDGLSQDMYDSIKSYIQNYVSENYT